MTSITATSVLSAQAALTLLVRPPSPDRPQSHDRAPSPTVNAATGRSACSALQEAILGLQKASGAAGSPPATEAQAETIARVRGWISQGLYRDAQSARDDAKLAQDAVNGKIGDLATLSDDQFAALSTVEKRVYREALLAMGPAGGPKTLAEAQARYMKEILPSEKDALARMTAKLAAGDIDAASWGRTIEETKTKIAAMERGDLRFTLVDPSHIEEKGKSWYVRNAEGVALGGAGVGGTYIDGCAVAKELGVDPANVTFLWSPYLGHYAVSWT